MEKTFKNQKGETMTMKFENDEITVHHSDVDEDYRDLITFLTEVQIEEEEAHALFDFCKEECGMDEMGLMMVSQEVNERRTVEHNKVICKLLIGDFRTFLMENGTDVGQFTGTEEEAEDIINQFIEHTFSKIDEEPTTETPTTDAPKEEETPAEDEQPENTEG